MKWVSYLRVSTKKQGKSGLGLEAQRRMIADYVAMKGGEHVAEYIEVESGKRDDRKELATALNHVDLIKGRLVVAKLDRLSRSLHFLTSLQKAEVDFYVTDLPSLDKFTVAIFGAVAEREREQIVDRVKKGMEAGIAKGRTYGTPDNLTVEAASKGRQLGREAQREKATIFASKVLPIIQELIVNGFSLNAVAKELNCRGIHTARGLAGKWSAQAIKNTLERTKRTELMKQIVT